jgi:4-carboxymuconolactone decarboxylase
MDTNTNDPLGGRLPLREPSTITGSQRTLYDTIIKDQAPLGTKAGYKIVTADGRLIGPFNAFLLNPEITDALLAFDAALKNHVSYPKRVREVIILVVGGLWSSKYELYTHSILGRSSGLSPEAVKSLASGELPEGLAREESLAARIARDMVKAHRIDDALFAESEKTFGAQGMYEIALLIGMFSVTCTILNLFEIPVPGPEV